MSLPPVALPIPVDTPETSIRVPLDGTDYIIALHYHERNDRWYLDLLTAEGDPLVYGIKIVSNWPLLRRLVDTSRPKGNLVALRAVGGEPPGFSDLGRSVVLAYVPVG